MTGEDWPNLPTMFFEQAAKYGAKPFLWAKRGGTWQPGSWREIAAQTAALARALKRLGVGPGAQRNSRSAAALSSSLAASPTSRSRQPASVATN